MSPPPRENHSDDLLDFLDESPSPYHAVRSVTSRLEAQGFVQLHEHHRWPGEPGDQFVVRGGSLVAWRRPVGFEPEHGLAVVGAHTDSPNLRLMPHPDAGRVGCRQLAVEVYGGALWNSWLDRDLGISGRVVVDGDDGGVTTLLVHIDRPLARIPQLAIHLDRTVNSQGLKLDPQRHLRPVWSLGYGVEGDVERFVAAELDIEPSTIRALDLMLHDTQGAIRLGAAEEFVSSARIDNLVSCWAATRAMAGTPALGGAPLGIVCLFDHEEVGSVSASGADSSFLRTTIERIIAANAPDEPDAVHRAIAAGSCVSVDGAHATHPNYPERHEPGHPIHLGAGPVLKWNANARYASDAPGAGALRRLAGDVGVSFQDFVMRADMACGSTIGPLTAANLGMTTVDVGVPQLAMHSIRELCARSDVDQMVTLLGAVLSNRES